MSQEKDIIANLRAIVISSKGGLPLGNVQNDYVEAFGVKVPLTQLGYSSLREFFEKNSSDFQLSGDKVEAVVRSNSAHITSLVKRQKGRPRSLKTVKNVKRPRRPWNNELQITSESSHKKQNKKHDAGPRFTRENSEKYTTNDDRESSRFHTKGDYFEKVTLRQPRDVKQLSHYSTTSRLSTGSDNSSAKDGDLFENVTKLKSITKTITNEKFTDSKDIANDQKNIEYLETFNDVEDLPLGKGAQSRLLRQKYKMMQEMKTSDDGQKSNTSSSDASELFFDLDSISSPSPSPTLPPLPKLTATNPVCNVPKCLPNQRAQARIAQIKSSIQATILQNDINGNKPVSMESRNNSAINNNSHLESSVSKNINNNEVRHKTNSNVEAKFEPKSAVNYSGTSGNNSESIKKGRISDPLKASRTSTQNDSSLPSQTKTQGIGDRSEYVKKLSELCKSRGLPEPSYKIIVREPKNEPKHYICKVQIEDYVQLSSYPIETQNPDSAKDIAAKKMYNCVVSDVTYKTGSSANVKQIVPRVLEIVSPTYGVWSDKLPLLYKECYKEDLPKDWLSVIMKTSVFEIDNFNGTRFIIRKKAEINNGSPKTVSTAEASRSVQSRLSPKLTELKLPSSEYWEIYITNINNSNEIWCRLIGDVYSDAYDAMMTKLELEPLQRKAVKPRVGGIYGIQVSAVWYRVKLVEITKDSQGLVFYIDVGDKDVVDLSELYEPEDVYFTVAPQAIMLSLYELGSFSNDEELTSFITGNLLGNTYIAEIIKVTHEIENSEQDRRMVRLWDTSTERDININQLLLNNIIKTITLPSLPSIGQLNEVFVSSVSDNGDTHVQTNKKSVHYLKCLIFNKIKSLEGKQVVRSTNDTIGTDIIYLTKCKKGDVFGRTKIIEIQDSASVDVIFIDYGYTERVPITDLIHLEKSSILQAIPAQALKVKLANVTNFNANLVSKLREIVLDQDVLMKVITSTRGNVASVEFFKRSAAGSILYSVNMKITNDPELKNSDTPSRRKSVVVGLEKVLPKNLLPPDLPKIGEHFEVFVTLASSPDLFIVQPLASRFQLTELMNGLQNTFSGLNSSAVSSNDFVIGEIYAVQHPDGNWYRGCAQAVVGSCNYSVYLCDFGDCIMVTREKIMPLPVKFRTLPYQAVRAALFGIPQKDRDWTPVDCINFHSLVVEKYFIATVMEINRDEKNPNYVSLGIILTDTSGTEDIHIHKVLLEKKNEAFTFIKSLNNS